MQAQFMAMLALAEGASLLSETIFENRYMHVPELARMGADITVTGRSALVRVLVAVLVGPLTALLAILAALLLLLAALLFVAVSLRVLLVLLVGVVSHFPFSFFRA